MRPVPRALVSAVLAGAALVGPPVAPALAAGSGSATVPFAAEAWYRTAPVCALPAGCPPAETPSPYAAETLHVGVQLGAEESRTYLALDLSTLPIGTKAVGGQLRLPVAAGPQDGSSRPEAAKIQACLVTTSVEDVDGSFEKAPAADCQSVSTPAAFVAATGTGPAAFTVDLTDLATAWQDSGVAGSLALLPAEGASPTDSWHVAFNGSKRTGEGVAKITASVSFVSEPGATEDSSPPPSVAPVEGSFEPPVTSGADTGFARAETFTAPESPLVAGADQAVRTAPTAVRAAAATPTLPVAGVSSTEFKYPAVFLLPLLLLGAGGWAGRALTRDLTPT
ncbi:MAG TPA: hypothetical protein VNB94_05430 [Mycobacteriales bacterium]|nr:hypothetical protein [Mycobacteriales bacterium]